MSNLINIFLFILSFTTCLGQATKSHVKILDSLPDNTIITLSNPKLLTDSEYFSQGIGRYKEDDKYTFRLTLNNKDTAYMYSAGANNGRSYYSEGSYYSSDGGYCIKINDSIAYRLPPGQNYGVLQFEGTLAVSFTDINSDSYTDIIILEQRFTGAGNLDQRYEPHYIFEIYFGSAKGFYTEKNLMYKLGLRWKKKTTIADIKNAYSKIKGH